MEKPDEIDTLIYDWEKKKFGRPLSDDDKASLKTAITSFANRSVKAALKNLDAGDAEGQGLQ